MRRAVSAAAAAGLVAVLAAGCSSPQPPTVTTVRQQQGRDAGKALSVGHGIDVAAALPQVRLGLMDDLCDGSGLAAAGLGYFGQELGAGVRLEPEGYSSPAAEAAALAAGRLDAAYIDPVAALAAWQARGGPLQIISGAGAGGAELVAGRRYTRPGQLADTTLAAPPGSSQAAGLKAWLSARGISADAAMPGTSPQAAVAAVTGGHAAAAWEPAPFDAQITAAGGHILAGRARPASAAPTAVLAVRTAFLARHRAWAQALLKAQVRAGLLMDTDPAAGHRAAAAELTALLGRKLPARILTAGFAQIRYTDNPEASSLLAQARQAATAGILKPVRSLGRLVNLDPLNRLLRATGQQPVTG